jgi:hypothetical protein
VYVADWQVRSGPADEALQRSSLLAEGDAAGAAESDAAGAAVLFCFELL